jgi:hypothetical protein
MWWQQRQGLKRMIDLPVPAALMGASAYQRKV